MKWERQAKPDFPLPQFFQFIIKLYILSEGYFKPRVMLSLSSLCKEKKSISEKVSSCDISNWGWAAPVSLWDHRWSVTGGSCFVCCSESLWNSICSLHILVSCNVHAHTHTHYSSQLVSLFVLHAPFNPAVYLHFPRHNPSKHAGDRVIPGYKRFLSSAV